VNQLIALDAPTTISNPSSYAPQVQADGSGNWYGNALRFATEQEAQANVNDLFMRWTSVRETRVMPSDDPPNYRWDPQVGLVRLIPSA
jgi:hypothetical protein